MTKSSRSSLRFLSTSKFASGTNGAPAHRSPSRSNVSADPRPSIKPIVQRARQGDAKAIAMLLNQVLNSSGITARVSLTLDGLWVVLQGDPVPNPEVMVGLVQSGLTKLDIPAVHTVQIQGCLDGQDHPLWTATVDLTADLTAEQVASVHHLSLQENGAIEIGEDPLSSYYRQAPVAPRSTIPTQQSPLPLLPLLRVLAATAVWVNSGKLYQVIQLFDRFPSQEIAIGRLIASVLFLLVSVMALIGLMRRPRFVAARTKFAFIHLGLAFLVHVGAAAFLLISQIVRQVTPDFLLTSSLFAVCILFWLLGCSSLARARGHHPLWGLLGLFLLDGAMLISLLPNRSIGSDPTAAE